MKVILELIQDTAVMSPAYKCVMKFMLHVYVVNIHSDKETLSHSGIP